MSITVSVPATTANLGPGFDCLGMALGLENRLTLAQSSIPSITVRGEGAADLSTDPSNLAYQSAVIGYELSGQGAPPFSLDLENTIPLARGLGSSSAAIVGGLLAGSRLAGLDLSPGELVRVAAEIEGHPDNVAPAIFGGCVVAMMGDAHVAVVPVAVPPSLEAAVFIPEARLATKEARAVLPDTVPRRDAVYNVGMAALLVAALAAGQTSHLRLVGDRLHEPYRMPLVPGMGSILAAARDAGAVLTALSGAGPSLLALADREPGVIADAMTIAAHGVNVPGKVITVPIVTEGARVVG